MRFRVPILLLVFNRPDYMERQIAQLRLLGAKRIYISGDGPRNLNKSDEVNCHAVHELVKQIDWDCKVTLHFSTENQGCKLGVNNGISWFFDKVAEGIILEDDCFPDQSFFRYAEELLVKYRHNSHVGMIAGTNPAKNTRDSNSYFFSGLPFCWGWATWRRAWKKYDVNMRMWNKDGEKILKRVMVTKISRAYWRKLFDRTSHGLIDTWDYQWIFTCWRHQMLCIIPAANLVTNIGFDARATHTTFVFSPMAQQKAYSIIFPLIHPGTIQPDTSYDLAIQREFFERNRYLKLLEGIRNFAIRFFKVNDRINAI